jgi:class 3 adenylate cyclase
MIKSCAFLLAITWLSGVGLGVPCVAQDEPVRAKWLTDFEKAKELAQREKRPVLLLFTGTEWCSVCVILEKKVLSRPEFAEFAKDRLVLVKVEFGTAPYPEPKEKRPPAQKAKVDLARRFNMNIGEPPGKNGLNGYPSTFLLTPKGAQTAKLMTNSSADQIGLNPFLKELSEALEQDLDPEEARAIIDPALKLMIAAVQRYDGYVVQSTGDGIFAMFGAPLAHEDHPQRALYAALRMQEDLRRYAASLRERGRAPIEMCIGVNTGEVVVRSIQTAAGHSEYTSIGHTNNLASRMQTLAATGTIAVTEDTRKLCEGYFTFRSLGPTRVKGVHEAVNIHEVTGLGPLRTRLQASARRGLSRFVGREAELTQIKGALELAKSGRGQVVAAVGEAGVGKSRLFFEFKATSQSALPCETE